VPGSSISVELLGDTGRLSYWMHATLAHLPAAAYFYKLSMHGHGWVCVSLSRFSLSALNLQFHATDGMRYPMYAMLLLICYLQSMTGVACLLISHLLQS
jgi:hypothetical protein